MKNSRVLALLLIFSLLFPTTLLAKKRGARLVVITKHGQVIGNLFAVKYNSGVPYLILQDSGSEIYVYMKVVKEIQILRRMKPWKRKPLIFTGSASVFGLFCSMVSLARGEEVPVWIPFLSFVGFIGSLLALNKAESKVEETIIVKGNDSDEINKILKKLNSIAQTKSEDLAFM